MLGVVLCGGDSTRMGRDKGLIPGKTLTWAGEASEKLAQVGIPVVLSVNLRQLPAYSQVFSIENLVPDDPGQPVRGPLAGLLSVHKIHPAEDLLVLACDMPFMSTALLRDLYRRRQTNKEAQAYLYGDGGDHQPLCGIYTASGLALIHTLYQTQRLNQHSMKYVLEQLVVDSQPIPEVNRMCFENFNYPRFSES